MNRSSSGYRNLTALVMGLGLALSVASTEAVSGISESSADGHVMQLAIARLQYDGGGDWYANPSSIPNLISAIRERTVLSLDVSEGRVRLTDEALWKYSFLHITGHGEIRFNESEVAALKAWLSAGGFLHIDDNYGLDESVRRELTRVFPDRPLAEVPTSHAVYNIPYKFADGLPKIHEHDGEAAKGLGIFLGNRLAVFYSYSADLGNGWEDVGTHPGDPPELHETALRMGVNLFVYSATSRNSD